MRSTSREQAALVSVEDLKVGTDAFITSIRTKRVHGSAGFFAEYCLRGEIMSELQDKANELNARMLQKRLYVVLTTALKPMSELATILPEHLEYMIDLEKRGILFASGPFLAGEHVEPGSGMTIIRASSLEDAKATAQRDPFNASGMRAFEIREWQLNEGSYTLTIHYSDGSYSIE